MDNLRNTIKTLFLRYDPDGLIAKARNSVSMSDEFEPDFPDLYETLEDNHNYDEICAVHQVFRDDWSHCAGKWDHTPKEQSIFNILLTFSNEVLVERHNDLLCRFEHLLRWRETTELLGEDLFTCSFLASQDLTVSRDRKSFDWSPILKTDNTRLRGLFHRGLAELHFHLYGSAFNFEINWLALMNQLTGHEKEFEQMARLRSPQVKITRGGKDSSLYALVVKAGLIRLAIYYLVEGNDPVRVEQLLKVLHQNPDNEILFSIKEIQHEIDLLKMEHTLRSDVPHIDYALVDQSQTPFVGERRLLYYAFKGIYGVNDQMKAISNLFHAYLVIKTLFRAEMVQVNERVGFENFSKYQDAKSNFLKENRYQQLQTRMAITQTQKLQNLHYLEARIAPKDTLKQLVRGIREIDSQVNHRQLSPLAQSIEKTDSQADNQNPSHFFVYHFIKNKHEFPKEKNMIQGMLRCRHAGLRAKVKKQTRALMDLRLSFDEVRNRVVGIDAASREIGCRPEIFATAFRYLKEYAGEHPAHNFDESSLLPFGFTFHAGEDFLDLIDGLRAIDETIRFLGFSRGDRLGHALALGTDPICYYEMKNDRLLLTKQELLDNLVWFKDRVRFYGVAISESVIYQLDMQIQRLLSEVYGPGTITFSDYLDSYRLHGDDPELYLHHPAFSLVVDQTANRPFSFNPLTFWERQGIRRDEDAVAARRNMTARALYYRYHYDDGVKERGRQRVEYIIPDGLPGVVARLQHQMQIEIAGRQIGIETNPTSNRVIGTFRRYDKHPVTRFFNKGLTHDVHQLNASAQIQVTINTDDQGVFSTLLENEYALMALALKKECNADGTPRYAEEAIYDWLEHIRGMGLQQAFNQCFIGGLV